MSQRLGGIIIGLIVASVVFLFLPKQPQQDAKVSAPAPTASGDFVCVPGNCGPRCGAQARTAAELLNTRITCAVNDENCTEVTPDPCPQEVAFDAFRTKHNKKIIAFWVTIYDHLNTFLKAFDTDTCRKSPNRCQEMINTQLFRIEGKPGFNFSDEIAHTWQSLLDETSSYSIGDTANQIGRTHLLFDPIMASMQRIMSNSLNNYQEYDLELVHLLRGIQYMIKYALLDDVAGAQEQLPWKFTSEDIEKPQPTTE